MSSEIHSQQESLIKSFVSKETKTIVEHEMEIATSMMEAEKLIPIWGDNKVNTDQIDMLKVEVNSRDGVYQIC